MGISALGLLIAAAFLHAAWNLIFKKIAGGKEIVWLLNAAITAISTPLALYSLYTDFGKLSPYCIVAICGSAVLQTAYFNLLNKCYATGDFSLVYPLARGSGPFIATLAAIVLLGEHPSALALKGTAAIGLGVFMLLGNPAKLAGAKSLKPILYALLTGACIASYTIWDKYAVSGIGVPPFLMLWGTSLGITLLMSPHCLFCFEEIKKQWREKYRSVIIVAFLGSGSYIIVLWVMTFTPVSYVAPTREMSILIGVLMGSKLLAEENLLLRLAATLIILAGITALAIG